MGSQLIRVFGDSPPKMFNPRLDSNPVVHLNPLLAAKIEWLKRDEINDVSYGIRSG
jgi:hypothetical protein